MSARNLYAQDQFGTTYGPLDPKAPKRSLLEEAYRNSAQPMWIDRPGQRHVQVGYVLASPAEAPGCHSLWCTLFWQTRELWKQPGE